jgi:hypothetical protein
VRESRSVPRRAQRGIDGQQVWDPAPDEADPGTRNESHVERVERLHGSDRQRCAVPLEREVRRDESRRIGRAAEANDDRAGFEARFDDGERSGVAREVGDRFVARRQEPATLVVAQIAGRDPRRTAGGARAEEEMHLVAPGGERHFEDRDGQVAGRTHLPAPDVERRGRERVAAAHAHGARAERFGREQPRQRLRSGAHAIRNAARRPPDQGLDLVLVGDERHERRIDPARARWPGNAECL